MPTELYFDADQYEVDGDRIRIKRGVYLYPWQVVIKMDAKGQRTASIKPGVYALRGRPDKFLEII